MLSLWLRSSCYSASMSGVRDGQRKGERMKRLRQIIFNAITAISLLLFMSLAGLWGRSQWVMYRIDFSRVRYEQIIETADTAEPKYKPIIARDYIALAAGRIAYSRDRYIGKGYLYANNLKEWKTVDPPGWHISRNSFALNGIELNPSFTLGNGINDHVVFEKWGFYYGTYEIQALFGRDTDYHVQEFWTPIWPIFLMSCVLPSVRFFAWMRRRGLRRENRCVNCGYDLRATPHRCPECGTIPEKVKV